MLSSFICNELITNVILTVLVKDVVLHVYLLINHVIRYAQKLLFIEMLIPCFECRVVFESIVISNAPWCHMWTPE